MNSPKAKFFQPNVIKSSQIGREKSPNLATLPEHLYIPPSLNG